MTQLSTDTFESLILEAKAAGGEWRREPIKTSAGNYAPIVHCTDSWCVLGAVIFARKIKAPYNDDGELNLEGTTKLPAPKDAAKLLGIPLRLAERIIAANDNTRFALPEDIALLDRLLGIAEEPSA